MSTQNMYLSPFPFPIPRLMYHEIRPGRDEPRVIKRRKDRYSVMIKPREELRKTLEKKRVTA